MGIKALFRSLRPMKRPSIFSRIKAKDVYVVRPEWMPAANMVRVIVHWTGGSYVASSLDKEHYHVLVEEDDTVVRGKHPITANEFIGGKSSDEYAAHTRATNTRSIGLSICGSAGAQERPFHPGRYPIKESQWQRAAEVTANMCKRYGIPVTDKTVLTHAEVQANLNIRQNGKWDIARLVFGDDLTTAKKAGDDFRRRVRLAMAKL